jgi:hypothetical protein
MSAPETAPTTRPSYPWSSLGLDLTWQPKTTPTLLLLEETKKYTEVIQNIERRQFPPKRPLLLVHKKDTTSNKWVEGLEKKVNMTQTEVFKTKDMLFFHTREFPWVNIYVELFVYVIYELSKVRPVILVTKGDLQSLYNYTMLKIRNTIGYTPNAVAPFVWVLDLGSRVVCIRTPISASELGTLLETQTGEKLTDEQKQAMQDLKPVTSKADVFVTSSELARSYSWVLGTEQTIEVKDLTTSLSQSTAKEQLMQDLQEIHDVLLRPHPEIEKCAEEHGLKYVYNMLYYPFVGPTHYRDVIESNFRIYQRTPLQRLEEDYQIRQTPYNKSMWIPPYTIPELPLDKLACFLPWYNMGLVIFGHMASDIQTWLANEMYKQPMTPEYNVYMKRLKVYTQCYMPDIPVEQVYVEHFPFEYDVEIYQISTDTTDDEPHVLPYDTSNIWLPDNRILVLSHHEIDKYMPDPVTRFKAMEKKIENIVRKRQLNLLENGKLKVAAYTQFFPVCYLENNQLKGLDVDIITKFAETAGLIVEFIYINKWEKLWFYPKDKDADVSIGGIGITKERIHDETEWTIPYFYVRRSVVYRRDKPIYKFPEDMTGAVKGTFGSTGYIDGQKRIKEFKPLAKLEMTPGTDDQKDIQELLEGKIQGLMRGSFVCKAICNKYGDGQLGYAKPWDILPELVSSDGECFAYPCRKDSGLATVLTAFLSHMWLNGFLEAKAKEYDMHDDDDEMETA